VGGGGDGGGAGSGVCASDGLAVCGVWCVVCGVCCPGPGPAQFQAALSAPHRRSMQAPRAPPCQDIGASLQPGCLHSSPWDVLSLPSGWCPARGPGGATAAIQFGHCWQPRWCFQVWAHKSLHSAQQARTGPFTTSPTMFVPPALPADMGTCLVRPVTLAPAHASLVTTAPSPGAGVDRPARPRALVPLAPSATAVQRRVKAAPQGRTVWAPREHGLQCASCVHQARTEARLAWPVLPAPAGVSQQGPALRLDSAAPPAPRAPM
jgi:hypothetical protein